MSRAKIEPPLAGVFLRRVGNAAEIALSTGFRVDKSLLGANARAYLAVYPSEVVLYRIEGALLPKPVPEVIRERPLSSVLTIDWRVSGLTGLLSIHFDDDADWTAYFAYGDINHVRAVADALSASAAPPIAS
jgi:hypothetical protein